MRVFFIICAVVYAVLRVARLNLRRKWRSEPVREVALLVFTVFLLWLAYLTIFPPYNFHVRLVNLELGQAVRRAMLSRKYFVVNVLGNVGMFVPVGLLTPLLFRVRAWIGFLAGVLISASIECAQYWLGRWCDIDDLWLNAVGSLVGVLLFLLLRLLAPRFSARCRVREIQSTEPNG